VGTVPRTSEPVLFFEDQHLPVVAAVLIAAAAGIPLCMAIRQIWPEDAAMMLRSLVVIVPIVALLAALGARVRITTRVYPDRIEIRSFPCLPDSIPFGKIARVGVSVFTPVRGRLLCQERTYMMRGGRGVEIILTDGAGVIVGSRDPERLAEILEKAIGR
jgi:hypothetical protein